MAATDADTEQGDPERKRRRRRSRRGRRSSDEQSENGTTTASAETDLEAMPEEAGTQAERTTLAGSEAQTPASASTQTPEPFVDNAGETSSADDHQPQPQVSAVNAETQVHAQAETVNLDESQVETASVTPDEAVEPQESNAAPEPAVTAVAIAAPSAVVAVSEPVAHSTANAEEPVGGQSDPQPSQPIDTAIQDNSEAASHRPAAGVNGAAAPQPASLEEVIRTTGMQLIETRPGVQAAASQPVQRLGRARKTAPVVADEPLQQVETDGK